MNKVIKKVLHLSIDQNIMSNILNLTEGGLNLDRKISYQEPTGVWFSTYGQDFQRSQESLTIIANKLKYNRRNKNE